MRNAGRLRPWLTGKAVQRKVLVTGWIKRGLLHYGSGNNCPKVVRLSKSFT